MDAPPNKDENLSLPKATVSKLIKEMLPDDIRCANESRDLIMECCVEFVHLVSSEANEICNKENKKTIAPDHVLKALTALGYQDFVDEVSAVYEHHKAEAAEKPKGTRKLESLGIPEEELLKQQQKLFEKARSELRKSQEASTAAAAIAAAQSAAAAAAVKKEST